MGQPFLFDEVFAPNRDLKIESAGIDDIPAWHPQDSFESFPRMTMAFWLIQ